MANWDRYERDGEERSERPRLFETLEEDYDDRAPRARGYSSLRKPFEERPSEHVGRDDYRRVVPREPVGRASYEDYAGMGNVTIYAPKSYSDVQAMIENLARKESVILNLESIELDSAQRILDFLSGASYALGGSMRRIKAYTFLITPQGTGITDTDDHYTR